MFVHKGSFKLELWIGVIWRGKLGHFLCWVCQWGCRAGPWEELGQPGMGESSKPWVLLAALLLTTGYNICLNKANIPG